MRIIKNNKIITFDEMWMKILSVLPYEGMVGAESAPFDSHTHTFVWNCIGNAQCHIDAYNTYYTVQYFVTIYEHTIRWIKCADYNLSTTLYKYLFFISIKSIIPI